jgi:hypothetical protein
MRPAVFVAMRKEAAGLELAIRSGVEGNSVSHAG